MQVTGEKKEKSMKKSTKTKVFQGSFGPVVLIDDFLPAPEELIFKTSATKVTLNLSPQTLQYFKNQARKLGSSYQRMIRNLLDLYVEQVKVKENASHQATQ